MPKEDEKKKQAEPEKKLDFATLVAGSIQQARKLKVVQGIEELEKVTSISQLTDLIVRKAWESGASDIHIDPLDDLVIIRYRIDGVLYDVISLKKEVQPLMVTRIKVLASLRTDEHLMAQDGRFRITFEGADVDLRISIIPTYHGENVVMRLLVGGAKALGLDELGFSENDLKKIQRYIRKPYGMILATGPTGSGKTTTLYSVLQILNARDVSIVTIEDPIEFAIPGITQIQVNPNTNLTFSDGLRSIVRQDPDIILVGEIRDTETAGIAVNAAMTGHLLLSTLHTNDAATTLPRLLDMKVEPFLIASTVNVAIGQRLVRKLCPQCRERYIMSKEEVASLAEIVSIQALAENRTVYRAKGCDACNHTGYVKRMGIYEILEVTEDIRELIKRRASADELRKQAIQDGMVTMLDDGFRKVAEGITSIEEILRVVHD
jgi:type II secretory ATPase GspE/PulE/Tfp pilus assembly ATPase PilB-like protein